MKKISRSPKNRAFTKIELVTIIVVIVAILSVGLLYSIQKENQRKKQENERYVACLNNLKEVGLAVLVWANDNNDRFPMAVSTNLHGSLEWSEGGNAFRHFQAISNYFVDGTKILICPSDDRNIAADFGQLKNENVSYFVGLDADSVKNEVMKKPIRFLAGDRNITNGISPIRTILTLPPDQPISWTEPAHPQRLECIALADGSVQAFRDQRSPSRVTGYNATNRIALPQ